MINLDVSAVPLEAGDARVWHIDGISARAMAIGQLADRHDGPLVIISARSETLELYQQSVSFFCPSIPVVEFLDWETLPYDSFSPNPSIVSSRLAALLKANSGDRSIVLLSLPTLLHRMVPADYLLSRSFSLYKNQRMKLDALRQQLTLAGYRKTDTVSDPGDFSVRGSLIDFFPMAHDHPVRVDFFGDDISEIRFFDSESQRSIDTIDSLVLMPAGEVPQDEDKRNFFLSRWNSIFTGDSRQSAIFCDVKAGLMPAGIEYYLPLYFDQLDSFFSYLPKNTLLVCEQQLASAADNYWREITERYRHLRHQPHKPILEPAMVFFRTEEVLSMIKSYARVELVESSAKAHYSYTGTPLPALQMQVKSKQPLAGFIDFVRSSKTPTLVCCDSRGRSEIISDLFRGAALDYIDIEDWNTFLKRSPKLGLCVAPMPDSLWFEGVCALISEDSFYGEHLARQVSRNQQQEHETLFRSLVELHENMPVVHFSHGIGMYKGLATLEPNGYRQEFVILEYAGGDKLYVPVTELHRISRYQGKHDEHLKLDRLGSDRWQKKKDKAEKKARDAAIELLEVQAKRNAKTGISIKQPDEKYHKFAAEFPYIETTDQQRAIEQVIHDMCSVRPMDRLVCGDVGFGKTEVAMRAAFLTVQSGYQVVMLAPTTLLARQHYDSFLDRFSSWAFRIAMISGFRSTIEIEQIWQKAEQGKIDILIGTHALISKKRNLDRIGLIIVDEEHRFGVRHKEHLKKMRAEVDILTLTATPIPRTLNFSLSGLRDLSIIATAPSNRLAIKTFIHTHKDHIVREAIVRELMRGGQAFLVYNQVQSIEVRRQRLVELIPEACIGVAHGQMPKKQLEQTMNRFYHRQFNVLLCTTIIETGIDIPSANTIVIERADKFGLAQLHQLRGRVGRSFHQAYAYLLVPEYLTDDAGKRLEAISSATTLGAGFTLAMNDMEIRGAGELLGESQSGEIEQVGFTMYLSMLEKAIRSVKQGTIGVNDEAEEISIDLGISALIPEDYLPDVHTRLVLYKRIVGTSTSKDLSALRIEIIDRFGHIPEELNNLFNLTKLRHTAQKLGIQNIQFSANGGYLAFSSLTPVQPARVIALIQKEPQTYSLTGAGDRLSVRRQTTSARERIDLIKSVMALLSVHVNTKEQEAVL